MRFTTRAAIQNSTEVRDASGGVSYSPTDVAGMESIPATVMPYTDENRQERYTESEGHWIIVLAGHWPAITTSMWVKVEGVTYEIERLATTKAHKLTTLTARLPSI